MPQHQNSSKLQPTNCATTKSMPLAHIIHDPSPSRPTNCATTKSMPLAHIYMTHQLQDQHIV